MSESPGSYADESEAGDIEHLLRAGVARELRCSLYLRLAGLLSLGLPALVAMDGAPDALVGYAFLCLYTLTVVLAVTYPFVLGENRMSIDWLLRCPEEFLKHHQGWWGMQRRRPGDEMHNALRMQMMHPMLINFCVLLAIWGAADEYGVYSATLYQGLFWLPAQYVVMLALDVAVWQRYGRGELRRRAGFNMQVVMASRGYRWVPFWGWVRTKGS